ncbi:MAG TPA: NAD(P)/FAD-dependent oxidoreductase, partial [Afifellaceae bacterium]|nr:NAD(P)/FAD-dependent oxidoreductase [Afifellaceae bacterium]
MTGTKNNNSPLPERIDTVVIGGSQAGLSVSYWLKKAGHPHIVLERDTIGCAWIDKRWESFCLVTPNWMLRLPGFAYVGDDPDGFLLRDEIVDYLKDYAASFDPPLREGVAVRRLSYTPEGYAVETASGTIQARNVVVCVGYFHEPKLPPCAAAIDDAIFQVHSCHYKAPGQLPEGGVLVVGSAQSGAQIAEELHEAGRPVWLSVSSAVREHRWYRGRDNNYWYDLMGGFDKSFTDPSDPRERYTPNPHCSGKNGGRALNLEKFAADGIRLVGRVRDADGTMIAFDTNMIENVRKADRASKDYMRSIDRLIAELRIDAPAAGPGNTDDGEPDEKPELVETKSLDLAAEGIGSIVWATGFQGN